MSVSMSAPGRVAVSVAVRHRMGERPDAADDEHLFSLINGKLRTIPGVSATETFFYVNPAQATYTWGAH
jgi:hypothetical protein